MKRLLLILFLLPLTAIAQNNLESNSYQAEYVRVYKALAKEPNDVSNLLAMAIFYSHADNPMCNLALAMKYVQKAETRYVSMVEDQSQYKEVSRLIRKKITIASVRGVKQQIIDQARILVSDTIAIGAIELDNIASAFKEDPAITRQVERRRLAQALLTARQGNSMAAYHAFIQKYKGTNEAETATKELTQIGTSMLQQLNTETAVDSVMQPYGEYTQLQRTANQRKATIAYAQTIKLHTVEGYRNFLSRYPASDQYADVLDKLESLRAAQYATLSTPKELTTFALENSDSPLSEQAINTLRNRIRNDQDVAAAKAYFNSFPLDADYSELYRLYYSWHSAEGNADPIIRFQQENPNFPYLMTTNEDLRQARRKDSINLMGRVREAHFTDAASHVRFLTGKKVAFVGLQRAMQPLIAAKNWPAANDRMDFFLLSFDETSKTEFDELRQIINAPTNKRLAVHHEMSGQLNIINAVIHPDGRHLYYTLLTHNGNITTTYICVAQRTAGKKATWKPAGKIRFANKENKNIQIFSFFDNGRKMLLGSNNDICIAEYQDTAWFINNTPPYPVNTDYRDYDAYMVPDGSGLLLASDRPNGHNFQNSGAYFHGDTATASDIYFVPLTKHGWGNAINLSTTINTPYCDHSPIISKNLKTLYFITDGHGGLGYGDIYVATRTNVDDWTHWSDPVNYGKEVNSAFNEQSLSFSPDEKRLYFCTNSRGPSDCFSVNTTHNATQGYRKISIISPDNEVLIDIADWNSQSITSSQRLFPNKTVTIQLHSEKYFAIIPHSSTSVFIPGILFHPSTNAAFDLTGYNTERIAGHSIPLPTIQFQTDSPNLKVLSTPELDNLARFANANADLGKLLISVNVPGTDDKKCFDLARERGNTLKQYLESQGLSSERIILSCYGNVKYKSTDTTPQAEVCIMF